MCVIPIGASSKIIQLRTILSNKSAGQVSRTGWAIATYSNLGMFSFVFFVLLDRLTCRFSSNYHQFHSNERHEYGDQFID